VTSSPSEINVSSSATIDLPNKLLAFAFPIDKLKDYCIEITTGFTCKYEYRLFYGNRKQVTWRITQNVEIDFNTTAKLENLKIVDVTMSKDAKDIKINVPSKLILCDINYAPIN